ncbi:hypothetical protein QQ045_032142 [Rhodiola kirilowii]
MAFSSPETGQQSQKLVLRVPVDCEGCRKKVTKILHSITGVESCDVDIKQQRVVVTGDVNADTLIAKLVKKTGKHAELWPEQKIQRKKKSREKTRRESDGAQSDRAEEQGSRGSDEPKTNGNSETAEGGEDEDDVEEDRQPEKKAMAEGLAESPSPSAEAMEKNIKDGNKNKSKGRTGNEKIQRRVENPPIEDNQPPPRHPEVNRQLNSTQSSVAPNHVPPRHPYPSTSPQAKITCATATSVPYPQPPPSYNHLQPIFTVSYNAAPQPQTSLSTTHPPLNAAPHSYPARPPPSYYYSHQQPQPAYTMNYNNAAPQPQANRSATQPFNSAGYYESRPSNYYSDYHRSYDDQVDYDAYAYRQQPESLGMFSDENPNACLIM